MTIPTTVSFDADGVELPYRRLETESIPLGGRATVEVQLATVALDDLRLDPANPRLEYALQAAGMESPSQADLAAMLWEQEEVKRLKRSIEVAGGLVEPVIVQGADGTVLEGNCRVVCYQRLRAERPGEEAWTRVRCRILPAGVDRETIDVLLGELHIAGRNEWSPFERAAHLHAMYRRGFGVDELAESYRMARATVELRLRAYALMRDDYLPRTSGDVSMLDQWPLFEELFRRCRPGIDEAGRELELAFVDWVLEGRIERVGQVRKLPRILADERIREIFEMEGFEAAWEALERASPELSSRLFRAVVGAAEALREAPLSEVARVREGDPARLREIEELGAALDAFLAQAGRGT